MKVKGKRQKQKGTKVWHKLECAFKLGFLQLISRAFFIFKLNFELALSIILKERELYKSKHIVVECRCLKIWLIIFFDMFLNQSFKIMTSFVNVARTTSSSSN